MAKARGQEPWVRATFILRPGVPSEALDPQSKRRSFGIVTGLPPFPDAQENSLPRSQNTQVGSQHYLSPQVPCFWGAGYSL